MKRIFLSLTLLSLICISANVKAQWSVYTTNAFSFGCPGYICITGPTTGYTYAINPPPLFGPNIPGSCGGSEYSVWAGFYTVNVIQNSNNSVVFSTSVNITQPPCGLQIVSPSVTNGCYSNHDLSFGINGFFCGSGNVTLKKNGTIFSSYPFNSPGQYYFNNLTPGTYQLIVADNLCSDTYNFTVADNCATPSVGFLTDNITKTSATLHWDTVTCGVAYTVQYKVKGAATWSTKYVSTNTGLRNLGGLTAGTIYKWRVKTKCNINPLSTSGWSAIQTFTTKTLRETDDMIAAVPENSISLFPNPAQNQITITCDFEPTAQCRLKVVDTNGKLYELNFDRISENEMRVDLSQLANGIYSLQLIDNDMSFSQKLVVIN